MKKAPNKLALYVSFGAFTFICISGCNPTENNEQSAAKNGTPKTCLASPSTTPIELEGGKFQQGVVKKQFGDELALFETDVGKFAIDAHEVTNAQFSEFVQETGYVTVAEIAPKPEDYPNIPPEELKAGSAVFSTSDSDRFMSWWKFVEGADWAHPNGPKSNLDGLMNYPVIHIAYEDALAYANWKDGDLPTEAEWEYAAKGELKGKIYEWGDVSPDDGPVRANTWQGEFPAENTVRDGYEGAAPIGCFEPNGYGIYDMTGNVWEWVKGDYEFDNHDLNGIMKGGSFLCASNYCARYRPGARHAQEKNFSTNHIGFRVIYRDSSSK